MATTQLSADERILVDVEPKYLTNFYEGRMDYEGAASAERYIGKWMRVSGSLKNVSDHPEGSGLAPTPRWLAVYVHLPSDEPAVSMYFNDPKWFERLRVLKPGALISVLGRIERVDRGSVSLEDCELVDE